ncbi:MAG: hypothetical protein EA401_14470, partial [Planctomycetota bacterium]
MSMTSSPWHLIIGVAVGVSATLMLGCGGSSSSSSLPSAFSNSTSLSDSDGFYMPDEWESPLPTVVEVDTDGNLSVENADAFSIDGLEAALTSLGILTTQSVGLQLPSAGSEFDYEERYRWDGDDEWDTDTFSVSWDTGTVLIGGTSVPAIVAEITYDDDWWGGVEREAFTIIDGWIWWLFDYEGLTIASDDLAIIDDMVPFLPVNFSAGDAFHFDYKYEFSESESWDDGSYTSTFKMNGRVAWKVDSLNASSPNGYAGSVRIV